MKAIIIGAGIGGLTTGIALQKIGIDVEIFEQAIQHQAVGAGLTLWANAIHALDKIGFGDQIRNIGMMESGGIRTWYGADIMTSNVDSLQHISNVINVVVHRADLQDVLIEQFDGDIHYGKQLDKYQQNSDTICALFTDDTVVKGDLLIACDGIHSVARQQMFPFAKPKYAGYTAFRGVVQYDHAQVNNMWGETWGNGNRFGITPLNDSRVYWFATANSEANNIITTEKRKSTLLDMFSGWHQPIEDLIHSTPDATILQHDINAIAPLNSWRDSRVVLSGDAAHAMTPNLGQGACQAIEDAVVLADCLAQHTSLNDALSTYETRRIPRANAVLKQSQIIGQMGQLSNPISVYMRNAAFRLTPAFVRNKQLANIIGYQV